jgi:hypothetical protein
VYTTGSDTPKPKRHPVDTPQFSTIRIRPIRFDSHPEAFASREVIFGGEVVACIEPGDWPSSDNPKKAPSCWVAIDTEGDYFDGVFDAFEIALLSVLMTRYQNHAHKCPYCVPEHLTPAVPICNKGKVIYAAWAEVDAELPGRLAENWGYGRPSREGATP